ncbi:unnamed protein product [Lathyrus oleraceus]
MAPPNPKVKAAFAAMSNLGIHESKVKPVLKKLFSAFQIQETWPLRVAAHNHKFIPKLFTFRHKIKLYKHNNSYRTSSEMDFPNSLLLTTVVDFSLGDFRHQVRRVVFHSPLPPAMNPDAPEVNFTAMKF